ncbi:hypothetical protein ABKN59_004871 [Abortiporus biennis]
MISHIVVVGWILERRYDFRKYISEIFDIPRLERALQLPVLEWQQVKDRNSSEVDGLGCWNIYQVDDLHAQGPRQSRNVMDLKLNISYILAPQNVKLIPGFEHDQHSSFWTLAPLAYSESRKKALEYIPHTGSSLLPDEHLLCYDYLFYVCADVPFEYENDDYPVWDIVLKHFRWSSKIEKIGNDYLRHIMNIPDHEDIPPYITIHARHGDFQGWCNGLDRDACFAPVSVFAIRVAEIQEELREKKGIDVKHVIMTSDEQDPKWWSQVNEAGWLRIDHDLYHTAEVYGEWSPVVIDAYVQSQGIGFVGTDRSTFSIIARRRVLEWNGGVIRNVKWGAPDADVH